MNKDSIIGWGEGFPASGWEKRCPGGGRGGGGGGGGGGKERHGHGDGGRRLLDGSEEVT